MKNDELNHGAAMRLDDDQPNLSLMEEELQQSTEQASDRITAMATDEDTRFCRWSQQNASGRKGLIGADGRPAEPWAYSADTRHHLVDEIVRDQVTMMKVAQRRSRLTVRGTEAGDMARGGKTQIYLDQLRDTRIRENTATESELAANWRQTHGFALMSITWAQEYGRDYEVVTLEGLQQAAQQGDQQSAALVADLFSEEPEVRAALAAQLMAVYEDLTKKEALSQLKALKDAGTMELPVRYLRVNEPRWEALKPWRDVFLPANTEQVQNARWIAWRVTLNASQLEEKALSEGWDPDFIAAVQKTEGTTILENIDGGRVATDRQTADRAEAMDGLHEVFYFYYTEADEHGVPCRYRTVMSPHIAKDRLDGPLYGIDEPVGYDHGKMPFVELRAELADRQLIESRGVAQIAGSWQQEKKHLRDAGLNQTDLYLQPPMIRPEREIGLPLKIQPRGEIGERRGGGQSTRQMSVPDTAPAAKPLELEVMGDADRYYARDRVANPVRAGLYDQDLADTWCGELAECWGMTLQLAQQFESDQKFHRIVGGKPVPFTVSRDEIQGEYDLKLTFNTDTLDPEKMKAKLETLHKLIMPMDRASQINPAPIVAGLVAHYFPEFSDAALEDVSQSSAREIEDEQKNWALIMAGEEPPMHEDNQNFQLRLEWLQNKMEQPGAMARFAQLPDSDEISQKRLQHLQFMAQQPQNAQTGRVGVQAG